MAPPDTQGTRPVTAVRRATDRAYVVWLNAGFDRRATVLAHDELAAARVFWAYDHRHIEQPKLFVWVREEGTRRRICVTLDPRTGQTAYADHPANRTDD